LKTKLPTAANWKQSFGQFTCT